MNQERVNILIVDDRPENLLAMESTLHSADYAIVTASSGEEALRRVLQDDYALILMDVQMPGLNGFDTVRMIKSRERSKQIPVIFVTALSHATEHVLQGYEVGAIDFLFKPIHPEALRFKVEQFVTIYKDRKRLNAQKELIVRRTAELEEMNRRLVGATQELKRMEALARAVGDSALDTFLTVDSEGTLLAANPAVGPMFGYVPDELISRPLWLLLPDTKEAFTEAGKRSGPPYLSGTTVEQIAVRSDGGTFPAEVQVGEALLDKQSIYVFSVRDITERKIQYIRLEQAVQQRTRELTLTNAKLEQEMKQRSRMSEELQQSYDRISDILESITDAFYSLDKDWRVTYMNRSAEAQLGISRHKLLNQRIWDHVPKALSKGYTLIESAMEEQKPKKLEFYSLITKSWLELRVFPSAQGISIYASDTTERHQMERDMRHSQERFYKIFKASPSLMAIQSLADHAYLDVNESWQRHTGYTYEELVEGKADLQITIESPDQGLNSGGTLSDILVKYVTRSGEIRTGLLSTEIIETHDQFCVLTVITDITDRVEMERELHRLDRLHMIGEMAAGIAHEIRNPMTTVKGFLQLMRSRQMAPPKDILDVMVEELNRANGIISEFLALAKNKTTDLRQQSLDGIIEAIYPLIQAEATLAGKSVRLALESEATLHLDEKEIRQMVLNLALNGLEAMEPGGVLSLHTYNEGDEVLLDVIDQGSGIPQHVLEKLGTPFFTTKEKGTGLGLAVCFSIASRHRAKLTWTTGPGGTTFTIRFPAAPGGGLRKE